VPVGVVLLPEDARPEHDKPAPTEVVLDADAAFRSFQAAHSNYAVRRSATGAVLIGPRAGTLCTTIAQSKASVSTTGAVFEVLYRIYRAWANERGREIPPGILGLSSIYRTVVAVDVEDGSLQDALTAAVEQVPGVGWALREGRIRTTAGDGSPVDVPGCNLAMFDGRSWLQTSFTLTAHN
jgi:hypothetical protein